MSGTDSSLFATGVYGVVKVTASAIFLIFIADSLGRRWSLLWTAGAQGIVLYIIGIYGRVQPPVVGRPVRRHFCSHSLTLNMHADITSSGHRIRICCHHLHLSLGCVSTLL